MPKRTPEEILKAIEDAEIDDEMERILAINGEEIQNELERARVDLPGLDARADKLNAEIQGQVSDLRTELASPTELAVPAAVVRPQSERRPDRKRRVTILAAAIVAAAAVAVAILGRDRGESSPPSAEARALEMRREAARACQERRWLECRQRFDAAKELDPKGDERQDVKDWRRIIENALTDL